VSGGASPQRSPNRALRWFEAGRARSRHTQYAHWACAVAAVSILAACSFKERADHCTSSSQCENGQICDRGFCVTAKVETERNPSTGDKDSGTTRPDASSSGGAGNTRPDPPPSAASDAGLDGAANDAGPMSSQDSASTACQDGASRSCMLPGSGAERCRIGIQRCEGGEFGACAASETPRPETCDGIDEDCDGKVDENVTADCYPDGMPGCTLSANTPPDCKGRCTLGKQVCVNGKLSACTGAITPGAEVCTTAGAASDEDCNGSSDEICTCMQGETRACYPSASNTLNVGKCKAGTQACANGLLGVCTGAVMPQTETCANEGADDNCDGAADNVLNRDAPCTVASNMGVCRSGTLQCKGAELICVTLAPAAAESCNGMDDDCDGKTDEAFNLQTDSANCGGCGTSCAAGEACCAGKCSNLQEDENNCGACGTARACAAGSTCCTGMCVNTMQDDTSCGACGTPCATGQSCCAGKCTDTKNDPKHCGTCTNECTTGSQPGCCGGSCVDFLSSQNCGRCGQVCGVLDGGVVCTCGTTQSGTMCIAPVLGVCL
jgi:hypothetical protein